MRVGLFKWMNKPLVYREYFGIINKRDYDEIYTSKNIDSKELQL
jgi:hypothetical protein